MMLRKQETRTELRRCLQSITTYALKGRHAISKLDEMGFDDAVINIKIELKRLDILMRNG